MIHALGPQIFLSILIKMRVHWVTVTIGQGFYLECHRQQDK